MVLTLDTCIHGRPIMTMALCKSVLQMQGIVGLRNPKTYASKILLGSNRTKLSLSSWLSSIRRLSNYSSTNIPGDRTDLADGRLPIVLSVHPESGLADEALDIQVSGLRSGQLVTLRAIASSEYEGHGFESNAVYRANSMGEISVQRDPSLGGSYHGIESHGLLWSLKPKPDAVEQYTRFIKTDVTAPFHYSIDLLDHGLEEDGGSSNVLASILMKRWYLAEHVERIPMQMGRAEGVWFIPKKRDGLSGPLPVVIDLYGLTDPLTVDRAALLSSHGFAVFAYDYYYPILRKIKNIPLYLELSVFQDILDYIKEHPRLDDQRVGILSSCVGSSLALHAVTRLNLPIKCIVASGFVDFLIPIFGLRLPNGGKIHPYLEPREKVTIDDKERAWFSIGQKYKLIVRETDEQTALMEKLECPFLMFAHGDEVDIDLKWRASMIKARMEKAGNGHLIDYNFLPGTGHFLDVPYLPVSPVSKISIPGSKELWNTSYYYTTYGGRDARLSTQDQVFAWRKIIAFLRKNLDVNEMYRQDWVNHV